MITAASVKAATISEMVATARRSVVGRWYVTSVTRLRLWSDVSFLPSNETLARFLVKKMVNSMRLELKT